MSVEKRRCLLKLPLFVLCLVMCWWCGSRRVDAETVENALEYGVSEYWNYYNGYTYKDRVVLYDYSGFEFVQVYRIDGCCYVPMVYAIEPYFEPELIYDYKYEVYDASGNFVSSQSYVRTTYYDSWDDFVRVTLDDGRVCYVAFFKELTTSARSSDFNCVISNLRSYDFASWGYSSTDFYILSNDRIAAGVKPDEEDKYIPTWNAAQDAPWFSLKKFEVTADDSKIYCSWDGVQGTDSATINSYENTYVRVVFSAEPDGTTEDTVTKILFYPDYARIKDNEFVISKDYVELPDGYEIQKVMATPYFHFKDDIEQQLYRGQNSVCEITIDGDFGSAIVTDPNDSYDADNPDGSLWDAIVNFTGDFFVNFDRLINDFDNSGMEDDNDTLSDSLKDMEDAEGTVMDDSVNALDEYDFTTSLTFSAGLVNALAFCKGFVDDFFIASGDLTVIVTVAFAMVFISIVAGIFRFASGRKK